MNDTAAALPKLRILSLGAGVQSTTMALMAAHGELTPMPDCAIFADTQNEPAAVYEHLRWLMSPNVLPFPVHIVTAGDLWKSASTIRTTRDGKRTYISTGIPVYTAEGLRKGIGKRQCTRDFKIVPINRKARELLGLKRIPARSQPLVEMWVGISEDEASRMKPNEKSWIKTRWPLIEKGMDREDCFEWMRARDFPTPPRSACTFCPFRDDDSWLALSASEMTDAIKKEKALQEAYARSSEMRGMPFLHDSRRPLGTVKFVPSPPGRKARQLRLFTNECAGMCGT